jgi:hypothetical protein
MPAPLVNPIQKRDDYICKYCGKDGLESLDSWHDSVIDHVIPRKYGGTDDPDNLVTSCHYCNAIKGDRRFASLEEAKGYVSERRKELMADYEGVRKAVRGAGAAGGNARILGIIGLVIVGLCTAHYLGLESFIGQKVGGGSPGGGKGLGSLSTSAESRDARPSPVPAPVRLDYPLELNEGVSDGSDGIQAGVVYREVRITVSHTFDRLLWVERVYDFSPPLRLRTLRITGHGGMAPDIDGSYFAGPKDHVSGADAVVFIEGGRSYELRGRRYEFDPETNAITMKQFYGGNPISTLSTVPTQDNWVYILGRHILQDEFGTPQTVNNIERIRYKWGPLRPLGEP